MPHLADAPVEQLPWPPRTTSLIAFGTVGMTLLALSGVLGGPHGPTGSQLEHRMVSLLPTGRLGSMLCAASMALGLTLVVGAWLAIGLIVRRTAPLRPLRMCAILWSVPLVVGPPLFSRDVYSYAALGRMVNGHLNPYEVGPAALGASSFVRPVGSAWLHTPSPYGPLFISITSVIVRFSHSNVLTSVLLLRAVSIAAMVAIAYLLPKVAVAAGKDPVRAMWLGVCNPLVLIHFVGGAHNDALMMALILLGLALAYARRPIAATACCTLAAAIKAPAAIAVVFVILHGMTRRDRVASAVTNIAVAAATFLAVTWSSGLGWGWVHAMSIPGTNHVLLTPTTMIAHYVSAVVGHDAAALSAARLLGDAATLAIITMLVVRAPKLGTARACGLALAVVVVLGPIVLPWYALWSIVVLAAAGRRVERGFAILASVILLVMIEPSGSVVPDVILVGGVCILAATAAAIVQRPVRHWIRHQLASALDEYRNLDSTRSTGGLVRRALPFRPERTLERPVESGLA